MDSILDDGSFLYSLDPSDSVWRNIAYSATTQRLFGRRHGYYGTVVISDVTRREYADIQSLDGRDIDNAMADLQFYKAGKKIC